MVLRSGRFIQSVEFSGLERGRASAIAKYCLLERIAVELINRERSTPDFRRATAVLRRTLWGATASLQQLANLTGAEHGC